MEVVSIIKITVLYFFIAMENAVIQRETLCMAAVPVVEAIDATALQAVTALTAVIDDRVAVLRGLTTEITHRITD